MKKISLQTGLLLFNTLIGLAILMRLLTSAPVSAQAPDTASADTVATPMTRTSIFAWEEETYVASERAAFFEVLEELEIDTVYQHVAKDKLYSGAFRRFMREATRLDKQIYYLSGDATWGFEEDAHSMRTEINRVAAYNTAAGENAKFAGIVFDVEPYLDKRWNEGKDGMMQQYVAVMQTAYQHAQSKGVSMAICLPHEYDNYPEELEMLISSACDAVLIMNYDRAGEQENMELEVSFAKKHNKRIECIFEFQDVGKHKLTENDTYATVGLKQARKNFDKLYQAFGYDRLTFSYHYYVPVRRMLGI